MTGEPGTIERDLPIVNKRGLHARAAAKFVKTVEQYDAEIVVTKDGQSVGGDSIMGLMMLAAVIGSSVHVAASGPQAAAAIDALVELLASGFSEDE